MPPVPGSSLLNSPIRFSTSETAESPLKTPIKPLTSRLPSSASRPIVKASATSDRFIANRQLLNVDDAEYQLLNPQPTDSVRVLSFSVRAPEVKQQQLSSLFATQMRFAGIRKGKPVATGGSFLDAAREPIPSREVPTAPFRVLDAPGLLDDYYVNLLSWSSQNILAVALGSSVFLWNAANGQVHELPVTEGGSEVATGTYVSCVNWSQDGSYLVVATSDGMLQIWDAEANQKIRSMHGNLPNSTQVHRIGSLSWNSHLLSSGCRGGYVSNHDTRVRNHLLSTFTGHSQEVCGLAWNSAGSLLASGGNDNLVNVWDARFVSDRVSPSATGASHCFTQHQAAVKAIGWCPWQAGLLASGGGSADRCLKFWNTTTGSLLNSVDTGSQVCALRWSPHHRELVTSHGFADNQLLLWRYPSLSCVAKINAHSSRVLYLDLSPDGQTVVSAASGGDETIKFWNLFPKSSGYGSSRAIAGTSDDGGRFSSAEDHRLFLGDKHSPGAQFSESNFKKLKIR